MNDDDEPRDVLDQIEHAPRRRARFWRAAESVRPDRIVVIRARHEVILARKKKRALRAGRLAEVAA